MNLIKIFGRLMLFFRRIFWHGGMVMLRPLFAEHGSHFRFDPRGIYSFSTIYVGEHVHLGVRPIILATNSKIKIGSHVMFGPEVTIRGGNHRIDIIGRYMDTITEAEKRQEDDLGVVIEDDVWVGTKAIILHGVTIGRGAVVAAGAIVTADVPPYSIVVGVPAKVIKFRWDIQAIIDHEKELYPQAYRLSVERLRRSREIGK